MASPDDYRAVELIKARDPRWAERGFRGVPPALVVYAMAAERERLAKLIEEKAGPIYNFPNGNQGLADWLRAEGSK